MKEKNRFFGNHLATEQRKIQNCTQLATAGEEDEDGEGEVEAEGPKLEERVCCESLLRRWLSRAWARAALRVAFIWLRRDSKRASCSGWEGDASVGVGLRGAKS